jgi:protein-tyrosine-phosphatase
MVAIVAIVLLGTTAGGAQDRSDSNGQVNDEKQMDLLFDRIMRTLPEGERSKVDSAATVKIDRNRINDKQSHTSERTDIITPRERLKELPDELKVQVERVITDMEQRKEDRKAQFRESLRNR